MNEKETEASELFQFDPEIERTLFRRRRELKQIPVDPIEKMGDQRVLLRDLWIPKGQVISSGIVAPVIQANNFELKPALINMNGVSPDVIKLSLFPFSLRDGARIWLHSLPPTLTDTWDHLLQAFLERYFPPTKAAEYRDKITRFAQFEGESLYDAWQRYNTLIRMCPHHGLERWLVLQTFYKGLTHQTRAYVDSAAGGGIMNKTLEEAFALIESMASHHFQWSSDRAVVPHAPGIHAISSADLVAAQVEILNKQMASILSERSATSVASVQFAQAMCDVCGVQGHTNGGQSSTGSKASFHPQSAYAHPSLSHAQKQPEAPSSATSRLEDTTAMLTELLAKMNSEVTSLKDSMRNMDNKFEAVLSRFCQNRDDAKLPARPEQNPKAQCGAITTCAVTTRAGTSTSPILPTPSAYVPPHVRNLKKQAPNEQREESDVEKNEGETTVNDVQPDKVQVSQPLRIPFPERLERNKDDKQYAKFLEVMKEV
nr:uncharacterized protein LOC127319764 [Lolium perenne]